MDYPLPISIDTLTHHVLGGVIYVPRVTGGAAPQTVSHINEVITDSINRLMQKQTTPSGTVNSMLGTYEIKTNERRVFSLSLSNYTYITHYAHGMTYMTSLTFDTQTGKLYSLKDFFKPDSHYEQRLSSIVQTQIKMRQIPLLNGFPGIQPDQDFYIADKTLVIYFQLYEITPYYIGFPMFPISVFDLQDIVDDKGPLGRMATNS